MLFWVFAYIFSLVLMNLHSVSFFQKMKNKVTSRDKGLFCFTLCLYLFSLASLSMKVTSIFNISDAAQVYLIASGGIPLFIAIWLAVPIDDE